ncbi:hypothetical protein FB480_103418 [Agrobacterium vitis]|nr:hypothetical protein FB480_103418 [Agrobacterium vitis]
MKDRKKNYSKFQASFVAGCGICALIIAVVIAVVPLPGDTRLLVAIFQAFFLLFVNGSKGLLK